MKPDNLQITALNPDSVPQLVLIESLSSDLPWTFTHFLEEFKNSCARVLGACVDSELVGFVIAHCVLDEAHVTNFAIHPTMRRKGVGKALMVALLTLLRESAVERVYLEVRATNESAMALYKSLGFIQVGTRKSFYSNNNEDAVTMALEIRGAVTCDSQSLSR